MAKLDSTASAAGFGERLKRALQEGLRVAGIRATVVTEPIPRTKLHRVLVKSAGFGSLAFTERQDLVWRIVDRQFSADEQLRISMILTMTPDEARGE